MIPIAQVVTLPEEWLWIIIASVGTFFVTRMWPVMARTWEAEAKARRDRLAKADGDESHRYLVAIETSATASATTAEALKQIAASLDMFARTNVAQTFQIDELRREMREHYSSLYAMLGGPQRRSTDRIDAPKPPPDEAQ